MVQRKTIPASDVQFPAHGKKKAPGYKSPALDKIHTTILAIDPGRDNPSQFALSIRHLCTVLLENIAIPPRLDSDNSYGSSFAFKTHLALIGQINRWLSHTASNSRRIKNQLNRDLLGRIRRHRSDTAEKKRYILLLWMLKFPLIEQALKRKNMHYKEDLYQGSFAILARCVERCDTERMEYFDAYYTKALVWNLPRLAWQIKNKSELPVLDTVISGGRVPGDDISAHHDDDRATGGSEDNKEIIENLLHEWWQKVKAGVKQITGTAEFSFDAIADVLTRLKTARRETSHLYDLSKRNELVGKKIRNPADHACGSSQHLEVTEFVRYVTMIYIAWRMLRHGKKQAQIARELNLSRERIRQYVQTWIRPYIKTKIKKVGLATARHGLLRDYHHNKKQYRATRVLLHKFFTGAAAAAPPPLITRVNPGRGIKLFKLDIRCPKKTVMPWQMVRIAAEPYGKEIRLIMSTCSHKERMGWCLVHWDNTKERLVSSSNRGTVSLIPFKVPEEQVLKQGYRHFVKAIRRGLVVWPPETKLKVKTSLKYPVIAGAVFGRSSALYLNLTNTHYLVSIIGVQANAREKALLVKFEAVEREGHVEFKHIMLSGTDQWHYRALIARKDETGKTCFYALADRDAGPVEFEYLYNENTR